MNKKQVKAVGLGVVCVMMWLAAVAVAQYEVPATINYQGKLVDPLAGPLTGVQQVQFRIYDSLTGGTLIWGRQFPISCTSEGVFNILLSDGGTPLSDDSAVDSLADAFQQETRFLELTVLDHGGAISPRQQLVSAPYAMQANYAHKAPGGFSTVGNMNVGGSLFVTNGAIATSGEVKAATLVLTGAATIGGNVTMPNGTLTAKTVNATDGNGIIPLGGIIMWSGASNAIPAGWALCNGQNGTPNLVNRFVVGAGGEYAVGATGGAKDVTLTVEQIPAHTHSYTGYGELTSWWGHGAYNEMWYKTGGKTSGSTGGGKAHENRPPYYALCYIMRIQ